MTNRGADSCVFLKNSFRDAQDYVSRLNAVGIQFDQVLEGLRHRQELGIHPPQFVITKVLDEMHNFVATPAEENILMVALMDKMKEADLPEDEQKRIALEAREAIENTAYPAYRRLIDHFEALDGEVEGNYGAWSLPDGDEYYRLALSWRNWCSNTLRARIPDKRPQWCPRRYNGLDLTGRGTLQNARNHFGRGQGQSAGAA